VKVDVIAHSMGGLVLRYYLRYGPNPLPEDGSMPELTWEGARNVRNAILVGTPSAGSVLSFEQLVKGVNFVALITPTYQPAVLGSMPSLYQLLPRTRHSRVVDSVTGEAIDLFDVDVWEQHGWGLADPEQVMILRQLLPDETSDARRREIAIDHLGKCLDKAAQLFASLDEPAAPPAGCSIHLIAGDALPTPDQISVDAQTGTIRTIGKAPGDNTVVRTSALMDERVGKAYLPRLRTPIAWESVRFLDADHLGLTRDRAFTNFVLYTLLEKPNE
jgi:pimeloyl-ACP methyl ester carboxylesterase